MAYTVEKTIDKGEYNLYEPSVEKDLEGKEVTIKKLKGTYR